jgi:type II secretory pathway pseudopilin PulG
LKLLRVRSDLQASTFNLQPTPDCASAFTLVEILIAIGILGMILTAIFASWTAILRATKTGLDAAASVQRSRIVLRTLEDSLGSAQSFAVNLPYYAFVAQNGSDASLSFVARLAKSFPRSGKFGDLDVRRLTFSIEDSSDGGRQFVLRQCPLMMELDKDIDEMQHPLVLAKNVKGFDMLFWDRDKSDWVDEWSEAKTNQLPRLVMFTLRLADDPHALKATTEITRVVALPSMTVPPAWQLPRGGPGGPGSQSAPGGNPGNQTQPPGAPANGGFPGSQPGGLGR